jgi:thioredoxin-dependent adenylylsulfate APS reductase
MAIASPPTSEPENTLSEAVIETIQQGKLASWDAERVLGWAIETFHPRLVLSASFGAPEGMVLLDLMHRIEPGVRVFTLDTGRLPQATHDLIDRVRDRYGVAVEVVFPGPAEVVEMVRRGGQNLFYESVEKRQLCCRIRKVEPMRRYFATAGIDAWVAGLRRGQGVTREEAAKIEIDEKHGGLAKINPLVDWTLEQVWGYVREHNVPVNRLHKQGYPSVGCDPCSRAIQPGEDIRAGRWWWENPETKECGIHVEEESHGSGI